MSLNRRNTAPFNAVIPYTLPQLHTGKSWYIDFYCFDPLTQKQRRKKYMLDNIEKITQRKKRATELITQLTLKLQAGWNPFTDVTNNRQYIRYSDILGYYHKYLTKLYKIGSIKENTLKDYVKRLHVLKEYIEKSGNTLQYAYQFDTSFVSDFLEYILLDRDASARTRNNYRTWLSSLANWMIEKEYILSNPIDNIRMLRETEKIRTSISEKDLKKLHRYLSKEDPHFLLLCQFAYYTLIRPDEITNIRLSDINIKEQKVFVASSVSKNRRDGLVGLNDHLLKSMIKSGFFDYPSHYYLFGRGFKPNAQKNTTRVYRDRFNKLRAVLHFPESYQFYSLKDSGIRDLSNAAGVVIARDQARHADISTTNKYLKADALTVHEETKHFKGNL